MYLTSVAMGLIYSFLVILGFLTNYIAASPLSLDVRTIDSHLFSNLNLFEQFAAAAYCPGNNDDPAGGVKLTCNAGNCPLVETADVTTVYDFENSFFTDVTGYIAVDHTRHLTVLAFRGSHSIRNWLADVDLIRIPVDVCSGCTAHQGFWDSWVEARKGILAALVTTAAKYPSSKVVVVGHSLGGAIAGFAAAEIRKKGINADLYTYGAPRIGGQKLSDFITNQSNGQDFRVTHSDDPVPRLPPQQLGFAHISPEYWVTSATKIPPKPADIIRLDGSKNLQGNGGQKGLDASAHLWYFGDIAGCSPTKFEFKKRDEYH